MSSHIVSRRDGSKISANDVPSPPQQPSPNPNTPTSPQAYLGVPTVPKSRHRHSRDLENDDTRPTSIVISAPSATTINLAIHLYLSTTLFLPPLLHPPARRLHPLLPTPILVHTYPSLLPPPPHIQPLAHRRPPHPALHKRQTRPLAVPARCKSCADMDGQP